MLSFFVEVMCCSWKGVYEKQKDVSCVYLCFVISFLFAQIRLSDFFCGFYVFIIVPVWNVTDGINCLQ